jgi:fibronectin-binding autotransporter adhesin
MSVPTWDGETDGDFLTGTNWDGDAAPAPGGAVVVDNGGLANQPTLATSDSSTVDTVAISDGTLTINGSLVATTGVTVSGGTFEIGSGGQVFADLETLGSGLVDVTGTLNGNLLANGGTTTIGPLGFVSGSIDMTAGEVIVQASPFALGLGDVVIDGGTLSILGLSLSVDSLSGSGGTIELSSAGGASRLSFGLDGNDASYAGTIETEASTDLRMLGAGSTELSGAISGGGTVTVGEGTLTLSGTNTYTGDTLVEGGTLIVSGGSAIANTGAVIVSNGGTFQISTNQESIGSLTSEDIDPDSCTAAVQLDAGLVITGSASTTFAGNIAGAGGLAVEGGGTLTLNGLNTMTGNLLADVAGSEIALTGSGSVAASAVAATNGGLISTDGGGFANAEADLLASSGGTFTLGGSEEVGSLFIRGTGTINVNGDDTVLTVSRTNGFTNIFGTIAGSGTLNLTGGTSTVFAIGNVQTDITLGAGATLANAGSIANISTSGTLTNTSNVTGNITVTGGTADINAGSDLAGTATVNVTGGTLNLNIVETIGTLDADGGTINVNAQLDAGTLSGDAGAVVLDAAAGIVAGAANASSTFGGVLSGAGFLTKSGTGTLTLTGANTYTGITTISGGTLVVSGGSAIANTGAVIVGNDATFQTTGDPDVLGNREWIGSLSSEDTNPATCTAGVQNDAGLVIRGSAHTTFAGDIKGAGILYNRGSGTLTLTGVNTTTGLLVVGGTPSSEIALTGIGSVATAIIQSFAAGLITTDGGAFANDAADLSAVFGGTITLGGSEEVGGLYLDGTGTINVNGGSTVLTANGTGARTTEIEGTIAGSGTLNLTGGTTTVFAIGNVQTDITLGADATMTNEGTIANIATSGTFTNTSTVTGNIKVAGGTADINAGSDLAGTATVSVSGGTFNLNIALDAGTLSGTAGSVVLNAATGIVTGAANASSTFGGALSGEGFLQKVGTGTLTLTGASTHTGTLIASGTGSEIALTGAGSVASGTIQSVGGLLTTDGGAFTNAAVDLAATTGGTITLGGSEEVGSLFLDDTVTINVNGDDTVLTVNGTNGFTIDISGTIAGSGTLKLTGGDTLVFSTGDVQTDITVGADAIMANAGTIADISTSGTFTNTGEVNGNITVTGGTTNINTGSDLSDTGTLTVTGGTVNLNTAESIGTLDADGGTVNFAGTALTIAAQAGALGAMTFNGGEGADTLSFTLAASLKSFSLAAASFSDWTINQDTITVIGNALNNRLTGNAAAETLQGGAGKDTIKGGNGRDTIDGGIANDKLGGGGARDTFLFVVGDGKDKITDFDTKGKDSDIIDLSDIAAVKNFKDLMKNHVDDAGSNIVIDLGGGQSIKLLGVQEKQLDADMFVI